MGIEQFLLRERRIPLDDAAHFFADLTKSAEWTDPPDMTGALEGQFVAPVEQVLHKLKDVCTAKLRLMMAYYTYAQSLNDHAWGGVKKEFYDHAEMEQEGAEYYLKRAAVLGGPIQLDALEPPPPSTNADSIFTMLVRAEQEGILAQRELRQMVGDENPMKVGIEEQMLKDQHHLDELFQMMSPEHRLALEQMGVGGEVPGTVPGPPAQGVPEEASKEPAEKNASFQLACAILKLAADKSDAELREVGRQRAVTNLAAEAYREAGRRGERAGHTLGSVAGLVGGAAAGKKYVGGKAGTIAGAVLGGVAGGRAGRELGSEVDIHKNAFEMAKAKLAFAKVADEYGNDESMSAPSAGELEPTNYLRAEMLGRQVQEQNEASYYRDLLSSTRQENATTAQQLSDMQAQMQQLQEQQAQVGAQVTQAMQHASMAQDQATQQAFEAAKARIGAQQLRQMMFEVASQDPASLGESALGPSMPGATEGSDPMMGQDPAASNPTLTADPNGASTQPGDGQPSDTSQGQAPTLQDSTTAAAQSPTQSGPGGASTPISVKVGSFAPALLGGGLGALTGAAGSVMAGRGAPALREKVEGMAAGQDGTFAAAARMAAAKAALAGAELAERHPVGAALTGAAQGALGGAAAGPALLNQGRQFVGNISEVGKALLSKVR